MSEEDTVPQAPFDAPDIQWDDPSGGLPEGAIVCGESDGHPVYAGRVLFRNELLIGTVYHEKRICTFVSDGTVQQTSEYTIMSVPVGDPLVWEKVEDNSSWPRDALKAGRAKNGKFLYVGRIIEDGKTAIGWLNIEDKLLHVAKNEAVKVCDKYEILVHQYLQFLCICPPCPRTCSRPESEVEPSVD